MSHALQPGDAHDIVLNGCGGKMLNRWCARRLFVATRPAADIVSRDPVHPFAQDFRPRVTRFTSVREMTLCRDARASTLRCIVNRIEQEA